MKIMAVDFGDVRTGVAVSDNSGVFAAPVGVIKEADFEAAAQKAADEAKRLGAGRIVVGYPKNMNGTAGPRAEKSELFAKRLEELSGLPVGLWDERCTTASAHVYFNAADLRGRKRKKAVDAAAAAIILQDYLDYLRNTGGK
jgi:putative Holliday junction resolvase